MIFSTVRVIKYIFLSQFLLKNWNAESQFSRLVRRITAEKATNLDLIYLAASLDYKPIYQKIAPYFSVFHQNIPSFERLIKTLFTLLLHDGVEPDAAAPDL